MRGPGTLDFPRNSMETKKISSLPLPIMNKLIFILLLFFTAGAGASFSTASESFSRGETILFSAAGFTNKSGSRTEQNNRAIEAARYLVIKKIEEMFSGPDGTEKPLPSDWTAGIFILNTLPFETADTGELYGVRLLGRVNLNLHEDGPIPRGNSDRELLETSFTSPKNLFFTGEEISFNLSGSKDFYACILDINEKKEAIQLLPNSFRKDNTFTGGRGYIFPDADLGDNFRLEVSPPYGRETIRLIASSYPVATILPLGRQEVFATSTRTFQELMLPIYEEITDSLMETGGSHSFQFVQVSTKTLLLTTEER